MPCDQCAGKPIAKGGKDRIGPQRNHCRARRHRLSLLLGVNKPALLHLCRKNFLRHVTARGRQSERYVVKPMGTLDRTVRADG